MPYAEVSVNSPAAGRRAFSYSIPQGLNLDIGQAVWVPFGSRVLQGVVVELSPTPQVEATREIIGLIENRPTISPERIELARWLSDYYLCPLFDAVALMLPPGFERRTLTFVSMAKAAADYDTSSLTPGQKEAIALIQKQGRVELRQLEQKLGRKRTQSLIWQLARRGLVVRQYQPEPLKVRPKKERYLALAVKADRAREEAARLLKKRGFRQAALLNFLAQHTKPLPLKVAASATGCSPATVNALVKKGLVKLEFIEVKREPISYRNIRPSAPLSLTSDQNKVMRAITTALKQIAKGDTKPPPVFLLHGVTGSGKTEIYLQALAETVRLGKRGIVLVPEIALTPQTIERFGARFPHRIAILHSQLSLGEQFDEWRQIKGGGVDAVIGPRSAIFAPQPELGLIVIDEEHEWTYKQEDKSPRYHARQAAIKLAQLCGAVVILGSATPDVETYYHARQGDYRLLELPERLTPHQGSPLPQVEVVDLREELKAGNRSVFSRPLARAIDRAVAGREQVILFFNRRGGASFIQCRSCGLVLRCKRCDATLSYHPAEASLVCHQCNCKTAVPQSCPRCLSRRIKFIGLGTQKLEQEAGRTFPEARLLRWDSDATGKKHSHQQILDKFSAHKADILIGTQMVTKGLDLPQVTLVGVVSADVNLHLPDFRAGERTFQLLSQVAGRAGRGVLGGRVIIQSYSPQHYAIQAALRHDYAAFYEQEIAYRLRLNNPPFRRLVRLIFSHTNDNFCHQEAARMRRLLTAERDARGIADISLIGPAPAFVQRRRGRFRWQLILRGLEPSRFLAGVTFPQGWVVDVDPIGLA